VGAIGATTATGTPFFSSTVVSWRRNARFTTSANRRAASVTERNHVGPDIPVIWFFGLRVARAAGLTPQSPSHGPRPGAGVGSNEPPSVMERAVKQEQCAHCAQWSRRSRGPIGQSLTTPVVRGTVPVRFSAGFLSRTGRRASRHG
jgi:hypothetical protein